MGVFHDQGDAKWIVIGGSYGVIMIRPAVGQRPAGLSAGLGWPPTGRNWWF
jgi:hypothetical protein